MRILGICSKIEDTEKFDAPFRYAIILTKLKNACYRKADIFIITNFQNQLLNFIMIGMIETRIRNKKLLILIPLFQCTMDAHQHHCQPEESNVR